VDAWPGPVSKRGETAAAELVVHQQNARKTMENAGKMVIEATVRSKTKVDHGENGLKKHGGEAIKVYTDHDIGNRQVGLGFL